MRTVKQATSTDFVNWTKGEWGQFGDVERDHLYTNATTPYFRAPQIYLAFPPQVTSPGRLVSASLRGREPRTRSS